MALLKSKFRSGLNNLTVEDSKVARIRLSPAFPAKPNLWVLYFCGLDDQVIRTWYYDCQNKRQYDLDQVLERCSHLKLA